MKKGNNQSTSFYIDNVEIIRLEDGYFWYKGEKIEDINKVYQKFCAWVDNATMKHEEKMACQWKYDGEGKWHTYCGNVFILLEGEPYENHMYYCPYCGKKIDEEMRRKSRYA